MSNIANFCEYETPGTFYEDIDQVSPNVDTLVLTITDNFDKIGDNIKTILFKYSPYVHYPNVENNYVHFHQLYSVPKDKSVIVWCKTKYYKIEMVEFIHKNNFMLIDDIYHETNLMDMYCVKIAPKK